MSTREERALQRAEQREKVLASPPPTQKAKAPEEAPRPVLLQCFLAASLAAATYASVQQLPDGIYVSGRTSAHVWWYGWVTALSTGLGALPMLVFRHVSDFWLGVCNAVAAGMMTAASAALLSEGLELSSPPDATLTPRQGVALGALVGVGFIMASQKVLESYEDVKLAVLDVVDMRKALLLVMVMTLHSFSEGIGIGVSFGGNAGSHLGMLITTTLAVHNVPEGFAVSVVLVSRGMSVMGAALWSVTTSLPQPLMALIAFQFVDTFQPLQAAGLGFAAGAMLFVAWMELFAEAMEACGLLATASVGVLAGSVMWFVHENLM